MIPSSIETDSLILEPLSVSDAYEMVSVLADESLYEFTGGEPPTLAALQDRYRRQVAGSPDADEYWYNWIIRSKHDKRAVGFVQATVTGGAANLAWVIGANDQSRGFAIESALAMCEWLALNDVRRVDAHIHPDHRASRAVAARIGLVSTGRFDGDGEEIWTASGTGRVAD